jgi:NAD(P)-dependent dehydrogenase (short-subunit alcohol dehydrogenase family)
MEWNSTRTVTMASENQSENRKTQQRAVYPSIRDRKVLITGGASGIGETLVGRFVEQGAKVAFLDIQDESAKEVVRRVSGAGHFEPLYFHCDLANVDEIRQALKQVSSALGGIDVLVNNAGNDQRHAMEEVTPELWDHLMAVNLRHMFFTTQAALPALRKSPGGSVINMSSISWLIPSTGLAIYVSAKASIVGLTRTLAHEVGKDNVRVNCVLPGSIATERQNRLWLTPEYRAEILARQALKRHLVPDEVANFVLFLAADDSSAMTGQSYIIDGGWV